MPYPNNQPPYGNGGNPNNAPPNQQGNGYVRNNMNQNPNMQNPNMPPQQQYNGYRPNPQQPYRQPYPQQAYGAAPAPKNNNTKTAIIVIGIVVIIAIIGAIVAFAISRHEPEPTPVNKIININFNYDGYESEFKEIEEKYFVDGSIPDDKKAAVLEEEYNYIVNENKTTNVFTNISKDEENNTIVCEFDDGKKYYHDIDGDDTRVEDENGNPVTPRNSSMDSDSDDSGSTTGTIEDIVEGNTYSNVNLLMFTFGESQEKFTFKDGKVTATVYDEVGESKNEATYSVNGDKIEFSYKANDCTMEYTVTKLDNSDMLQFHSDSLADSGDEMESSHDDGLLINENDRLKNEETSSFYDDFNDTSWISKKVGLTQMSADKSVIDLDFFDEDDKLTMDGVLTINGETSNLRGYAIGDEIAYFQNADGEGGAAFVMERYNGKTYCYNYGGDANVTYLESEELVENK